MILVYEVMDQLCAGGCVEGKRAQLLVSATECKDLSLDM